MRIAVTILLLAVFLCSCAPIEPPAVNFQKYELKSVGLTKSDVVFLFDVENPNNLPLGFKEISYSVKLDGSELAVGTFEGFDLSAQEKKTISIPVEVVYSKLVGQAANIALKFIKKESIKYAVEGEIKIRDNFTGFSTGVPLKAEGELKFF
jgi:LEA14-like dessication related protein